MQVSLDGYAYPSVANAPATEGVHEFWNAFDSGASVPAGGVYVICHGSADDSIKALCDEEHTYLSNGNDGYCLVQGTESDYTFIDCVGDFYGDPGSGWDVCGVSAATKDNTLSCASPLSPPVTAATGRRQQARTRTTASG